MWPQGGAQIISSESKTKVYEISNFCEYVQNIYVGRVADQYLGDRRTPSQF